MRNRRHPNRNRVLSVLATAAMCASAYVQPADGATFTVSWIGPASSVYSNAANWSGGVVPNNSGSSYYNVVVNRVGGATVGGNTPATILNLNIGPSNWLIPQSEKPLTLIGTASNGSCTISNMGTLAVTAAIPYSRLALNGSTTNLTGGGTLAIFNGVVSGNGGVLHSNNTIVGSGSLGNDSLAIRNNGTIIGGDPDFAGQQLTVNPGNGGLINNGTLQAGYNGILSLYNGVFNNNGDIRASVGTVTINDSSVGGGNIIAQTAGNVVIYDSTITGSTLSTQGAGLIRASHNTSTFTEVSNTGNLAVVHGGTGIFTSTNNNSGTIHVVHPAHAGNATLGFGAGSTALSGSGTVLLNTGSLGAARIHGTGTLVNGNKIIGAGTITSGMFQNTGLVRATGEGITLTQLGAAPSAGVNAGSMDVQSNARMNFTNGNFSNIGTINISGGATLTLGAPVPATFFSSGTLNLYAGARLYTDPNRTLDTTGGAFHTFIASQANLAGPLKAGSITLNGTLNQAGPMNAQEVSGVGVLNLTTPQTTATVKHVRLGSLSSAGTLTIAPGGSDAGVSRLASAPQFTGDGRMDLTDNALIVDYTTTTALPAVQSQLLTGYAGGDWTGAGLTSSAAAANPGFALGYGEAGAIFSTFPATFAGQNVDSSTVVVKYARYGDANLDGVVNLADFNKLAANFGSTNVVWTEGDFNYDGAVNLADFNRLAANFGLSASGPQVTPDDWSALGAAVPEPGGASALILAAAPLARRRRRN